MLGWLSLKAQVPQGNLLSESCLLSLPVIGPQNKPEVSIDSNSKVYFLMSGLRFMQEHTLFLMGFCTFRCKKIQLLETFRLLYRHWRCWGLWLFAYLCDPLCRIMNETSSELVQDTLETKDHMCSWRKSVQLYWRHYKILHWPQIWIAFPSGCKCFCCW